MDFALSGFEWVCSNVGLLVSFGVHPGPSSSYWYASKSLLVLLSLVAFGIVARKYKYWQLNEEMEINLRQEVENVFERNFDEEFQYYQQLERYLEGMQQSYTPET